MSDCLETYISNWPILVNVCEEHHGEHFLNIANRVKNYSIKRNAEDLLVRLKPISIALDRTQSDNLLSAILCKFGNSYKKV